MGGSLFKTIAKIAIPAAASFIPGIGPLGVALAGAGATKLTGGSWGDALKAGAISGLGSLIAPSVSSAFSKAFPETASSLGIGQSGLGVLADRAGSTAGTGASFGGSGLTGATYLPEGFSLNMGDLAGSTAATAGNFGQQIAGNVAGGGSSGLGSLIGGQVGSQVASGLSEIPVIGSLLDKGIQWASENPMSALMGAGQLMSSYNTQQQAEEQARAQAATQQQNNAQNLDAWRLVLNQKSPRSPVDMGNTDWNRYGEGPERQFFDNNTIGQPVAMAQGGPVHTESDMTGPLRADPRVQQKMLEILREVERKTGRRLDEDEMQELMIRMGLQQSEMVPAYAAGGPVKSLGSKVKSLESKYPRKSGKISGDKGGMADKVKALLSDGEFVIPADVVSHLGDGSTDAGAKSLQDMIAHIRSVKTKSTKQPKAIRA